MIRPLLALILLLSGFSCASAQAPVTIQSTDGYSVTISLRATGIQVNADRCANNGGYNYDVAFDYDITFSGGNSPGSLWTLQASTDCGGSQLFLPLPNSGGVGSTTTNGNASADCSTPATLEALACGSVDLTVNGPGIPAQTIPMAFVLPVEFVAFTADLTGKTVQLDWATATESGNDFFDVQRSDDLRQWSTIGRVNGAGTSSATNRYTFTDSETDPGSETLYYRLKQTDFDGSFLFSDVVRIDVADAPRALGIYPNPTNGLLTVEASSEFLIYNTAGRVVWRGTGGQEADLSQLPDGVYLVRADGVTRRVVKR